MGTRDRLNKLEANVDCLMDLHLRNILKRGKELEILSTAIPETSQIRKLAREEAVKAIEESLPKSTVELAHEPVGKVAFGQEHFISVERLTEWLEERLEESSGLYWDLKKSDSPGAEYWNGNSMALSGIMGWLKHA